MPLRSNETESFNKEELFKKLYERFHKGDLLVTVATGSMSDAQAERSGLVGAHAYALLNIVEIKVRSIFDLVSFHLSFTSSNDPVIKKHESMHKSKCENHRQVRRHEVGSFSLTEPLSK